MTKIEGKVAIVTGASRGIGVELARALARAGTHVSLAARSGPELEQVRADLDHYGVRTLATVCDVSVADDRANLVERTVAELGPIDLLVNNAGIEDVRHFEQSDPAALERVINVNLTSSMLLTRQVLPSMLDRKAGHVVNIASAAGKVGPPYMVSYAASKFGLVGMTQSLACEFYRSGVHFSVVCPAFVTETGMYARWAERGATANRLAGSCTPEAVVKATLRAIRKNKLEVTVNKPPIRPSIVLGSIAPSLTPTLTSKLGYTKALRRAAELDD